jgi:DNA-binding GntR family transcriptional regulator
MNAVEIDRRSLADQIFAHIKRMILTGELKAGERIPEARIGALFGVSRTPMRESLRRLEQYGLIHIKPRSYAEVVGIEDREVDQVAEVRASIESLSARLLAAVATDADLEVLAKLTDICLQRVEQHDLAGAFEVDSEFHCEIARRCGNPYVAEIMQRLDARIQLARLVRCGTAEHVQNAIRQHGPLLAAIRRHDTEEAGRLMRAHVRTMAPEVRR